MKDIIIHYKEEEEKEECAERNTHTELQCVFKTFN